VVREVADRDVERALELVNAVFSEFVAVEYSEQGRVTFEVYLQGKLEEVSADLASGHKQMWAYYQGDEILGVIAMKDVSHISLLFVDKGHHKKGIARQMLQVVLEGLQEKMEVTQITVNSSPYAVRAYECLGFVQTEEQQERDGILYVPMTRLL